MRVQGLGFRLRGALSRPEPLKAVGLRSRDPELHSQAQGRMRGPRVGLGFRVLGNNYFLVVERSKIAFFFRNTLITHPTLNATEGVRGTF